MNSDFHVCLQDNVLVASLDPSQEYSSIGLRQVAQPMAHAAEPGRDVSVCGTEEPLIALELGWAEMLPGHWLRCRACLAACPLAARSRSAS